MELLKKRLKFLITTGAYMTLIFEVIIACFRRPPTWGSIREQLYEIGVMSLPVVAMTGFSTGLV
jgi:phospholipid/cholesterol/gamma-HCH transport system permease protein